MDHDQHVDLPTLHRFAEGTLDGETMLEVGWHLYHCRGCRELLARAPAEARVLFERVFAGHAHAERPEVYEGLVAGVLDALRDAAAALETERLRAPELARRLEAERPAERHRRAASDPRYQTYGLAEHLLDECRRHRESDPVRGAEQAELALSVAEHLDPATYDEAIVNDLKAEAWAELATCRRLRADLVSVYEAFELAESFRRQGTGDPAEEAALRLLEVDALLDLGRWQDAEALLDRAAHLAGDAPGGAFSAALELRRARLLAGSGRAERAVDPLIEATEGLDPATDPQLAFELRCRVVETLVEAGRAAEALGWLPAVRRLRAIDPRPRERLRSLRLEGNALSAAGRDAEARRLLVEARDGFLAAGALYEAALTALDLGTAHRRAGVTPDPAELLPLPPTLRLRRRAVAALEGFQQAVAEAAGLRPA